MQEEWLPIDGFDEYVLSNYGTVRNELTGRTMTRSPVQYGMLTVAMMRGGVQIRRSIGTLVAQHFLPAPEREDFNTPIHLDGDRANCRVDNLMWRPRWFAINFHLERRHGPFDGWSRDIRLLETGEVFDTLKHPAEKYGLLEREIHRSLTNGTIVYPQGFRFIFIEN